MDKVKKLSIIATILVISLLVAFGCSDDSTGPSNKLFSFNVTVAAGNGGPMPNIRISRQCHLEGVIPASAGDAHGIVSVDQVRTTQPPDEFSSDPPKPNPASGGIQLSFDIPVNCAAELRVLNWLDKEMIKPFFVSLNPGMVILSWPLTDTLYIRVPDGIYHCTFVARNPATEEELYSDSVYFTSYNSDEPYRTGIGHTNARGRYSTADKGYFPSVQGNATQMGYTVTGEPTNEFWFSDSVTIGMHTELPVQTSGWVYWMKRGVRINKMYNSFKFDFDPDDSMYVDTK